MFKQFTFVRFFVMVALSDRAAAVLGAICLDGIKPKL